VEIHQRIAVMLCLGLVLVAADLSVAQSSPSSGQGMSHAEPVVPGLP
jgi:hypothetical protein